MLKNYFIYFIVILYIKYVVSDEYKSSLTFVIDDTGSMSDDINAVVNGANAIFDTVLNNNSSQIENFILVTFNDLGYGDTGVLLRANTKDRVEFKSTLSSISVHGGGDCPEYAMSGIKLALEESLPASYLYVFTDASAKDYIQYEEIKSIAQTKQSQIVFVLTGDCGTTASPDYQIYHNLADVTSGEVFNLEKQEVSLILEYVKNNIKGRRTSLARKTLPAGTHDITFTADPKMKDTTLSLTSTKSDKPSVDVTAPDGSDVPKEKLLETDKIKVYSVSVTKPGVHTVKVDSKSETRTVLTAISTINFKHGFSTFKPLSIIDTSTRPPPDVKSHLSIKLTEGDIELRTAKILDMYDNVMIEMPLKILNEKTKFYVTEPFDPPKSIFRIEIVGYDHESKSFITRTAPTPVEPQRILPGESIKLTTPTVIIEGEGKVNAEYDEPLQLICTVKGYPKPNIVWKNKDKDIILSSEVSVKELPYDYVSILTIGNVNENAMYRCEATNPSGSDAKDVTVETKRKRYFDVSDVITRTTMEYGKEGKIYCNVDAYPPVEKTWYKNGRPLLPSSTIDISSDKSVVTIKYTKPSDKGKYICEARNEDKRQLYIRHVTVTGVERPIIDKTITEVSVKRGFSTEIECKLLKGKPKPSIRWSHGPGGPSGEFNPLDEWDDQETIVIKNADKHNSGIYQCVAKNEISMDYHEINLAVEYPPTIAKDAKWIKGNVDSEIFISCNVDGFPSPNVTWFKDGVEIVSGKIQIFRNQTLKIVAEISDSGYYACKATNRLGSVEKNVKVDISVPVTITPPKETNLAVLVGSTLTLPCEAKGYPKPNIKWVFNSLSAPHQKEIVSKTEKALQLDRIQLNQEGYYTCIASNSGGVKHLSYNVQVFAPPIIENTYKDKHFVAVEGDLVLRITCKASGNPKPTITWKKDEWNLALGSTYSVDGGTLVIKNVPLDASGVYKCEAENPRGIDQEIYEVTVENYPPMSRVFSSIVIEEGKPVQIKCDVPHNKIDQLRWYKNGELIRHGELFLTNPSARDSGHYTCRVSNFLKSVSGSVKVNVGYKPRFTTEEDENIEIVEGPPVILVCESSGIPKPTVTWYHDGKKLDSTEPAYYFPTGINSPGQYKCEVKNIFGSITRTFNATPRDCLINIDKLTKWQPLMVTSNLTWPIFERYEEFLTILKGEQFVLFCPRRFKMFPTQYIMAFCDGGTNILINGRKYDYTDIQCTEEVTHVVQKTGKKCMPGDTETIKIVFNVLGHEKIEAYQICLDKTNNVPLYAKHSMQSLQDNYYYETSWSDSDQFRMNFEEVYDCKNQVNTISGWLGKWFHLKDDCCFSKRQLVNPRDLFPGVAQKSTYSYFNVVPHWSTCNDQNWNDIEQKVRKFANNFDEILVWTGTAKELSLPTVSGTTTNNFFMDRDGNRQPVPVFLWKVVQNHLTKSSLAIVQVNVPDLSPSEASKYVLCTDICEYTDWMRGAPNWHDVKKGYTYCCILEEFEKAFGFKGVFEPYKTALLTAEAFVLPRSSLAIIA